MESRINGHTKLFALIGSPVGHSGSPAMYNHSFERLGLDSAYLAFDIPLEKTKDALNALRTLHAGGLNVTMPCKTAAANLVDHLSPAAKLIGACNTIVIEEDGTMTGHNTDGIGFVKNLQEHGVTVKDSSLVILGAGGAATAIAVQTALDGAARISIFNRRDEFYPNGESTVQKLLEAVPGIQASIHPLEDAAALAEAAGACDILINATKVGMKPLDKETLIDPSLFRRELVVADTVYNPRDTRMISEAKKAGCKAAVGGIGMLLWQGAAAFKLFTQKDMPAYEVLDKFFS